MTTLIPLSLSVIFTLTLFGLVCFAWGYLKGRGYEYIEIVRDKKD
jgi:hypothetical protein